jgi:hypothetical protein
LIDDAGALADQTFAHPMESLQVELFGVLVATNFHRGALDRLSEARRFWIARKPETHLFSTETCSMALL